MDKMFDRCGVVFPASTSRPIAEPCVEMYEFISAAARSAVAGVEVLDRLNGKDDPHLVAALKRYVEETGQALKEVDNRLKALHSGLNELFPEFSSWKELISRRDVIAHGILTLDVFTGSVRKQIGTSGRFVNSCLTSTSPLRSRISNKASAQRLQIRGKLLRELEPSEAGQEAFVLGGALVVVCLDARKGIVAFRLGRSPHNTVVLAVSHPGEYTFTFSKLNPSAGDVLARS